MKHLQEYFKSYPGSEKVFETSDGTLFHEEGDANLHAKSLEDKTVKAHLSASYIDKVQNGDAAATATAINARVAPKVVTEEEMNEGNDPEAVNMAVAASLQNAEVGEVVETEVNLNGETETKATPVKDASKDEVMANSKKTTRKK